MSGVAIALEIEGAEDVVWRVARVVGRERVCAPFRFTIFALAERAPGPLEQLVTKKATLTWSTGEGERNCAPGGYEEGL